jgi:hypothetical protein
MTRKTEIVNGQEVAEGWGEVLETSQEHPDYLIDGRPFKRIPYGQDFDGEPLPDRTSVG